MLCGYSYQSSESSMEKELLRNLKLNASRNPSILHSFVTELSFWDVEGRSRHGSRSNSGLWSRGSASSSRSRKSKIPSMHEATRNYEREEKEIAAAMSKKSKAVWKSAVDPATGKIYYYDAVSRRTQWHKVNLCASCENFH
jgi:hypothetical protein